MQLVEKLLGAAIKLFPVDDAEAARLASEEYVFTDVEVLDDREFLEDDGDAGLFGLTHSMEAAGLTVNQNLSIISTVGVDAAQDLHQR